MLDLNHVFNHFVIKNIQVFQTRQTHIKVLLWTLSTILVQADCTELRQREPQSKPHPYVHTLWYSHTFCTGMSTLYGDIAPSPSYILS